MVDELFCGGVGVLALVEVGVRWLVVVIEVWMLLRLLLCFEPKPRDFKRLLTDSIERRSRGN